VKHADLQGSSSSSSTSSDLTTVTTGVTHAAPAVARESYTNQEGAGKFSSLSVIDINQHTHAFAAWCHAGVLDALPAAPLHALLLQPKSKHLSAATKHLV
jgi:hypothetical protein